MAMGRSVGKKKDSLTKICVVNDLKSSGGYYFLHSSSKFDMMSAITRRSMTTHCPTVTVKKTEDQERVDLSKRYPQ